GSPCPPTDALRAPEQASAAWPCYRRACIASRAGAVFGSVPAALFGDGSRQTTSVYFLPSTTATRAKQLASLAGKGPPKGPTRSNRTVIRCLLPSLSNSYRRRPCSEVFGA